MNVEGFTRVQEFKSISELEDVSFPQCFDQCTVAQLSDNAYCCCEVHCKHKVVDHSLDSISRLAEKLKAV